MTPQALATLIVIAGALLLMAFSSLPADAVLFGGVVLLLLGGVLSPEQALDGLANSGLVTIAALLVVAQGLERTGAVDRLAARILGHSQSTRGALGRLVFPVAGASAILNNTPIVAAMMPGVITWARRHGVAPSRLLLPLSYAAIVGGTCTLIGTSTNLVVAGLVAKAAPDHPLLEPLSLLSITPIGLPVAVAGCLLMVLLAPMLLPDRRPAVSLTEDPREYTTELVVPEGSVLAGQTLEEAGLRHLPHAFLVELIRGGEALPAVAPEERLQAGDHLVLAGVIDAMVDLQRTMGLALAADPQFRLESEGRRLLVEAVVSPSHPLVGQTIRDGRFREVHGAAVLAMARDGRRVPGRLGDAVLRPGDVLLLEAPPAAVAGLRGSRDFHLASAIPEAELGREGKAPIALAILAAMVLVAALEWLPMLQASLLAAFGVVAARCCTVGEARRAVDLSLILSIAAALGLGRAMELTGLADGIARGLVGLAGDSPMAALAALYLSVAVLTELVTNNAAAVLGFPLALALAERLGIAPMPFILVVLMAASASFLTPIGYQTNLMVYGPGGYRFTDYLRLGVPMALVTAALSLALIGARLP